MEPTNQSKKCVARGFLMKCLGSFAAAAFCRICDEEGDKLRHILSNTEEELLGLEIILVRDLMMSVPSVAYDLCLNLHATFSQTTYKCYFRAK